MKRQLSRRTFLASSAAALALSTAGAVPMPVRRTATAKTPRGRARKRVALIATEVRKYSHAQHFLDRFLEGYGWQGKHHYPPFEVAGLYVDQFPDGDLSRERERRRGARIYPSIAEALTLGTSKLQVDGVLVIAEHGKYPRNEKGQTLYPRAKFFDQVTHVFEASGRTAPVFNDKHLSTTWPQCLHMVETARRLGFPFMAGSSLPVTWRIPSLEMPLNTPLEESVCLCYGGVDSYDFHGIETAQCMSERRAGGEAGVKAVQALRGPAVWSRLEQDGQTRRLFFAALARSFTAHPLPGYTFAAPSLDWARRLCPEPIGYFYTHSDKFKTAVFLLNGLVSDFTYAGLRRDSGEIVSCQMYLPMPPLLSTEADFFNPLVNNIEQMFLSGRATYPVERTLLTSGMTLFAVESLYRGQVEVATPEMANIHYAPSPESHFWRT